MKGRRLLLSLALAALVALALAGAASAAKLDVADHGGRPFSTELTGAAEVPDPGDPDGSGTATITVNPGQEEVCWELLVTNITLPATGAHIHEGAVGEFGDVVVELTPPVAVGEAPPPPRGFYQRLHNRGARGGFGHPQEPRELLCKRPHDRLHGRSDKGTAVLG